jgi:hypothetical protein
MTTKNDICFATFARNERIRLPIWLRHYRQFITDEDIYVIDQNTTDGSTNDLKCNVIYEPHEGVFDQAWLRQMLTKNLKILLEKYHIVVLNECDELMVTHNNENLTDYLIKTYKQSLKNGATYLFDVLQVDDEPDYVLGDKINNIRNYICRWEGRKHTIHTSCLKELPNGFHSGYGYLDNNLSTIHIQCLNYSYFTEKIKQRIKEKEVHGQGDDYGCWEVHYKVDLIGKYMNDLLGRKELAPTWFKNNIYL